MNLTSLYAGLSGLNANALQLSLIGNNLANVNTPGYKSSTAAFQDLLSEILTGGSSTGNVDFLQVGLGTKVSATNGNFSQGSLQTTGINTNVAIQGEGFFIVRGSGGINYTRAGDFHLDASGNLVTPDGANVQGYTQTDPATNRIVTNGDLHDLIVPPGTLFSPVRTSITKIIANLDAAAANGTTFASTVRVFDSLGGGHQLNFVWTKTGVGAYSYNITVDGGEVTGGTAGTPFNLLTPPGTMTFNATGQLTTVNGAPAADKSITTPTFTNGAAALTFNWDLVGPTGQGFVTSYSAASATSSTTQNGAEAGSLSAMVIGADGAIQGVFSNGQTAELGRIVLATFNNPPGLLKLGSNRFNTSNSSGEPSAGVAGDGGRGTLAGSAVELSNVDMAAEFINMIVAQRGYQANSKVITTADQILQEAINLKQ